MKKCTLSLLFVLFSVTLFAQNTPTVSGGVLHPAQSAYNVHYYGIDLSVIPEQKQFNGEVEIQATIVQATTHILLDLDDRFEISNIALQVEKQPTYTPLTNRVQGKLFVKSNTTLQPGQNLKVQIKYTGKPRIAPKAPWIGGIVWSKTEENLDWIASAVQMDGADLWFPCKDHPSDEADSVDFNITVPKHLTAVSIGKLTGKTENTNTSTFHWSTKFPINTYNIAINIGPFKQIESVYKSTSGTTIPVYFWVLPEKEEEGKILIKEFNEHLAFYEQYLGPYPFGGEKYGVVHTPHLGMEHQSIIAYGANFKPNKYGWDVLHHHELGHEWWGNLLTVSDWKDFWIQEGFCSYMQPLYNEFKLGKKAYTEYIDQMRKGINNDLPVARKEASTARDIYFKKPCYSSSDGDIYAKGALILHTLRNTIGDDAFFKFLKELTYPEAQKNNFPPLRFVSTQDILHTAERVSGKELDWFFEVYLYQSEAPNLIINKTDDTVELAWQTMGRTAFNMPVELVLNGKSKLLQFENNKAKFTVRKKDKWQIDPENKIYKKSEHQEKRELTKKLAAQFPKAKIKEIKAPDHFKQAYEIVIPQYLDHQNPKKGTFDHHLYFYHSGYDQLNHLETEGYNAYLFTREIPKMFKANQLIVEYRFYGNSRPTPIPWTYLTNDQAIEDYHRIIGKFKTIYSGKWVSSGVSKGGETTLIYKSKYPEDVSVAIPYVAPIILDTMDVRTNNHIKTIGEGWCRKAVQEFQRNVLVHRKEILALLGPYCKKNNMSFSIMGKEAALEYAALEFPFSFWQWSGKCEDIPGKNASPEALFNYLDEIVGIGFYSDKTIDRLWPSFYQHMKELGYYGFDTAPVKDLLEVVKNPNNRVFAPQHVDLSYNPEYMRTVLHYLETQGNNILYIYGEYDTWGACAVTPGKQTNALKMVLKKGAHGTRIRHFSPEDQYTMYDSLENWLGEKPIPLTKYCPEN